MSCWKIRDCRQTECEGYGRRMDFCWFSDSSCDAGGDISFKERFSGHCLNCDLFSRYLQERINVGSVEVLNLLRDVVGRINRCDTTLESAYFRLQYLSERLSQLYELSDLMLSSLSVDKVLYIILTAVTSGQALGLNRAFLFIVDEEGRNLKGRMAVGPIDLNEASRIWAELSSRPMSIQEIVEEYERYPPTEQNKAINEIIQGISIPLSQADSVLTRSIIEKISFNNVKVEECSELDRELMERLGSTMITVVPLLTRDKAIGVLMVDNFVTNRPVTDEDLELLKLYANYAALAIVNASLYESLEKRMRELEEAYDTLQQQEKQLIESEKFAAMGKMAASIAHEIKNPLVSIGGFARLVYRKVEDRASKESLQIVINETVRLENLLQNILSFARPPE
ncbi:TPA: GAF domain-containing sensor histidine kinase, partial [Candidatus Poribacteria bacterium]|nr:GAF domain-containing sensor histidine kinase [Candidatus Poribacteria bacterium]